MLIMAAPLAHTAGTCEPGAPKCAVLAPRPVQAPRRPRPLPPALQERRQSHPRAGPGPGADQAASSAEQRPAYCSSPPQAAQQPQRRPWGDCGRHASLAAGGALALAAAAPPGAQANALSDFIAQRSSLTTALASVAFLLLVLLTGGVGARAAPAQAG